MVAENAPEFSRPVAVDTLTEPKVFAIEASADERQALARRLGVLSVDRLTADLEVTRQIGSIVHLGGRFEADITQACVVTLVPLHAHIAAAVDRRYGPAEALAETDSEVIPFDDDAIPDPMIGGVIDMGEAVSEQLALEMDPFPRAEGAEFAGYSCGPEAPPEAASPFSALESLFKKPK
jgi:uncharacterized metal-binding protein YceD (DUF177 family)